jgi:hypothetical protein
MLQIRVQIFCEQASLGGKMKGKAVQYHGNIAKDDGQQLYQEFFSLCQKEIEVNSTSAGSQHPVVHHGQQCSKVMRLLNSVLLV